MLKHIKYSLAAFLCLVVFSLISQCGNGEELAPVTEKNNLGATK